VPGAVRVPALETCPSDTAGAPLEGGGIPRNCPPQRAPEFPGSVREVRRPGTETSYHRRRVLAGVAADATDEELRQ